MALKFCTTQYKQKTDSCFWFVRKDKKRIKGNV